MQSIDSRLVYQQEIERLTGIMRALRDPMTGCAWDKQQDFKSLLPYLLEECYEVMAAVEAEDDANLREELGDLLFQIIFYCQLADEQQLFNFSDVCYAINEKMLRRHPHIFGDKTAEPISWEQLKQQERRSPHATSFFDGIPATLTALMSAQAVQKCCSQVGFDWNNIDDVFEKVVEELNEVKQELVATTPDSTRLAEELGDLMFAVVNLVRHAQLDSEQVLREATHKFKRRFLQVEQNITQQQGNLQQASAAELEKQWQQVKKSERL